MAVLDDLATRVPISGPARRVVALVPSLTESVAITRPGALVGATDWCTHPTGLTVARVRGSPPCAAPPAPGPTTTVTAPPAPTTTKPYAP